jgi:hypothetical protein
LKLRAHIGLGPELRVSETERPEN